MCCAPNGQSQVICFHCRTTTSHSSHTFWGAKAVKCTTHWVFPCPLPTPIPSKTCSFWVDVALPRSSPECWPVSAAHLLCFSCLVVMAKNSSLPPLGSVSDTVGISAPALSQSGETHQQCWAGLGVQSSSGNCRREGRVGQSWGAVVKENKTNKVKTKQQQKRIGKNRNKIKFPEKFSFRIKGGYYFWSRCSSD